MIARSNFEFGSQIGGTIKANKYRPFFGLETRRVGWKRSRARPLQNVTLKNLSPFPPLSAARFRLIAAELSDLD
jgi:hypothetical protein